MDFRELKRESRNTIWSYEEVMLPFDGFLLLLDCAMFRLVVKLFCFLRQAWGAARRVSKDDWLEWLRRLSLELLKDSSSPSLRSCWALAQAYNPMARYSNYVFFRSLEIADASQRL